MKYLDMVVQESMRLYPIAPRVVRVCSKTTTIKDGVCVPKGAWVVLPIHALHMDPNNWEDPEKFDPMRLVSQPSTKGGSNFLKRGFS